MKSLDEKKTELVLMSLLVIKNPELIKKHISWDIVNTLVKHLSDFEVDTTKTDWSISLKEAEDVTQELLTVIYNFTLSDSFPSESKDKLATDLYSILQPL